MSNATRGWAPAVVSNTHRCRQPGAPSYPTRHVFEHAALVTTRWIASSLRVRTHSRAVGHRSTTPNRLARSAVPCAPRQTARIADGIRTVLPQAGPSCDPLAHGISSSPCAHGLRSHRDRRPHADRVLLLRCAQRRQRTRPGPTAAVVRRRRSTAMARSQHAPAYSTRAAGRSRPRPFHAPRGRIRRAMRRRVSPQRPPGPEPGASGLPAAV